MLSTIQYMCVSFNQSEHCVRIGPWHNPVTWYKTTYTGEQVAQWEFQNNAPAFVLEVPLHAQLAHQYM